MALRSLSICTGGTAGIELGLRIACGDIAPLCYVEREKTACETLVARFEDGSLEPAPIWSDLSTFDATGLRGLVDICSAGLPCQPYSVAGKRKGHSDERAIWPEFIRVVGECQPQLVFLENVPEFLKHFRPVGDELQRLGYTVEEPLLISAANVGAAHKRLRVFILAHRNTGRLRWEDPALQIDRSAFHGNGQSCDEFGTQGSSLAFPTLGGCGELREQYRSNGLPDGDHTELEDAARHERVGWGIPQTGDELDYAAGPRPGGRESEPSTAVWGQARGGEPSGRRNVADAGGRQFPQPGREPEGRNGSGSAGEVLAQPAEPGLQERRDADGLRELAPVERSGVRIFSLDIAPGPFAFSPDNPGWAEILERAPWLAPAIEPGLRVLVDGSSLVVDASRTDQLRSLGNGVVPLQAACAFRLLMRRAGL